MKKTYKINTNNQELLISKQKGFDETSRWIEFQKTRPKRVIPLLAAIRIFTSFSV